MTTPDIAGLCERLRAALKGVTPGPWDDTRGRAGLRIIEGDSGCPVASYVSEKDAAFIALSREAAPVLLDTLERQAAEIERLQNLLNGRDDFIVGQGLWPKFCDGLPPRAALTGEDTATLGLSGKTQTDDRTRGGG
jgi:hypothetical protein